LVEPVEPVELKAEPIEELKEDVKVEPLVVKVVPLSGMLVASMEVVD
jgi:hypothetical protein